MPVSKIDQTELVMMYKLGFSDQAIASQFNVSQSAVAQQRYSLGLKSNYAYPYWKDREQSHINIKVDSNWELFDKYAEQNRKYFLHIWNHKEEKRARVCIIRGDNSLWIECDDVSHAQYVKDKLVEFISPQATGLDKIVDFINDRSDLGDFVE